MTGRTVSHIYPRTLPTGMTDTSAERVGVSLGAREATVGRLRLLAGALAALTAGIHLLHPTYGVRGLVVWLRAGYLGDPRAAAFVLSGFLLLAGLGVGYYRLYPRAVYLGGIAVCLLFLGGFALWHTVLGHGAFWPYIEAHGHTDTHAAVVVLEHLVADGLALASKLAEAALAVTLAALYRLDAP